VGYKPKLDTPIFLVAACEIGIKLKVKVMAVTRDSAENLRLFFHNTLEVYINRPFDFE